MVKPWRCSNSRDCCDKPYFCDAVFRKAFPVGLSVVAGSDLSCGQLFVGWMDLPVTGTGRPLCSVRSFASGVPGGVRRPAYTHIQDGLVVLEV